MIDQKFGKFAIAELNFFSTNSNQDVFIIIPFFNNACRLHIKSFPFRCQFIKYAKIFRKIFDFFKNLNSESKSYIYINSFAPLYQNFFLNPAQKAFWFVNTVLSNKNKLNARTILCLVNFPRANLFIMLYLSKEDC